MNKLDQFIYIYKNHSDNIKKVLKRHPFSTVVYIKTFSKSDQSIIKLLNDFKNSSDDYHSCKNIFKYSGFLKSLIIRHPIKDTFDIKKVNVKKISLRETHKIIDKILDTSRIDNKIYIDKNTDMKKNFLLEKDLSKSEYNSHKLENKKLENHDPKEDIYYATEKDINKVRSDLGEVAFRYRVKYNIALFPPSRKINYDNDYLYDIYVKPYERNKKGKN